MQACRSRVACPALAGTWLLPLGPSGDCERCLEVSLPLWLLSMVPPNCGTGSAWPASALGAAASLAAAASARAVAAAAAAPPPVMLALDARKRAGAGSSASETSRSRSLASGLIPTSATRLLLAEGSELTEGAAAEPEVVEMPAPIRPRCLRGSSNGAEPSDAGTLPAREYWPPSRARTRTPRSEAALRSSALRVASTVPK
mmetsp:Transcript_18682/g.46920  ORF Transcript_18682/g.46920 Transcript_18682/m.46920 type:complete len:201 (-) Transcript_18682:475-1077(-)